MASLLKKNALTGRNTNSWKECINIKGNREKINVSRGNIGMLAVYNLFSLHLYHMTRLVNYYFHWIKEWKLPILYCCISLPSHWLQIHKRKTVVSNLKVYTKHCYLLWIHSLSDWCFMHEQRVSQKEESTYIFNMYCSSFKASHMYRYKVWKWK